VYLDAAPNAMPVIDDHGRSVLANLQTKKLFGYSSAELPNQKEHSFLQESRKTKSASVAYPSVHSMKD
jgi:PAS domain S-box-containing protein